MRKALVARNGLWIASAALCLCLLFSCAPKEIKPQGPQLPEDKGLSVSYQTGFFRHMDQMPSHARFARGAHPASPIAKIDHQFGDGPVFGTVHQRGVCFEIEGFIEFDKPGIYMFKAKSNDGVRLYIDGKLILEDPDVHSDRLSQPGSVTVTEPGKKPILVRYFQRKGTAALFLYWQKPEDSDYTIVPESAFFRK
ncbi:MAG: PA14 domain-containing protein [Thermodesulfobacteriota bacterium]